jgi:urea transport system substrate-binding protein
VEEVDVIFCCWTSSSRKAILPVVEELNGLVFYPVQYEGEESSLNVFYTGAAPNQQAIPAVDYFLEELGVESFALLGTDYVYPRTTNRILEQYLLDAGIPQENIFVNYTPFGHSDWSSIVADVVALGESGQQVGVISTINGDANVGFYNELAAQGVTADDIPVVAFSVGEEELSGLDTEPLEGHLAAWNYFMSADTPENEEFIAAWHEYTGDDTRVTNDPMEAHYIGFNMWVAAVEAAGTTDPDAVRAAMYGLQVPNLTGGMAEMLPNHHLTKPVLIGEIRADGQFDIISQTEPVPGDAWTDFLPESAVLVSDWPGLGMRHVQHRDRDLRAASVELLTSTTGWRADLGVSPAPTPGAAPRMIRTTLAALAGILLGLIAAADARAQQADTDLQTILQDNAGARRRCLPPDGAGGAGHPGGQPVARGSRIPHDMAGARGLLAQRRRAFRLR